MPRQKESKGLFWRILLNLWTLLTFAVIIYDFIKDGALAEFLGPVLLIYTAILAVYSAEKEFERWNFYLMRRHIGEVYVALWTLLLVGITLASFFMHKEYMMDHEIIATYIVVLGVLAITRKSRNSFREKCEPR